MPATNINPFHGIENSDNFSPEDKERLLELANKRRPVTESDPSPLITIFIDMLTAAIGIFAGYLIFLEILKQWMTQLI